MVRKTTTGRGIINEMFGIDGRKPTQKEINKRFDKFAGVENIKKKSQEK